MAETPKTLSPFALFLFIIDVLVCIASFWAGLQLRTLLPRHWISDVFVIERHLWILVLVLTVQILWMFTRTAYRPLRLVSQWKLIQFYAVMLCVEVSVVAAAVFSTQAFFTSRSFTGLFIVIQICGLLGIRIAYKTWSSVFRSRIYNHRRFLVVSDKPDPMAVSEGLLKNALWDLAVIDAISTKEFTPEQLASYEKQKIAIDDCLVDCAPEKLLTLKPGMAWLQERGVNLHFTMSFLGSFMGIPGASYHVEDLGQNLQMLSVDVRRLSPASLVMKRFLDLAFASVGTLITLLFLPFIAAAIKLDSKGPVLFRQIRVGQAGRRFKCYKFRTMYADAEKRKEELIKKNEMKGPMFKMEHDPRITRVGRFLRKTSLDEFPQFWNILRGEMSLIGTRPPTEDEVERYRNSDFKRISIKPGLTGLWQVSGRSQVTQFDDVVRLDIQYIENWSLWLDLKIILKTFFVLVTRRGAA